MKVQLEGQQRYLW